VAIKSPERDRGRPRAALIGGCDDLQGGPKPWQQLWSRRRDGVSAGNLEHNPRPGRDARHADRTCIAIPPSGADEAQHAEGDDTALLGSPAMQQSRPLSLQITMRPSSGGGPSKASGDIHS
jgi:hypothetical protein